MMRKNRDKRKKIEAILLASALTVSMAGCSSSDAAKTGKSKDTSGESVDSDMELSQSEVDTEFTDNDKDGTFSAEETVIISLNGASAEAEGNGVNISGNTVTITKDGTYLVKGTLDEGKIRVEASDTDKIQLVLDGADIHCETSAAIYIKQADKVFLTLAEGSFNTLSGGETYVDSDENTVDGVVFSKDDLTINGSGSLTVDANYKHGIVSKDDLAVTGGKLVIDAVSHCMTGKDCVKILDGTFALTGQGKGIKSENTEETTLGNIYVAGGNFEIDTEDDAVHAGGSILVDGGTFTIHTGDDAFHADMDAVVNGGMLSVVSCYEGLEGHRVVINGGEISVTASDDGINAASPGTTEMQDGKDKTTAPSEGGLLSEGEMPSDRQLPADGKMQGGEAVPADEELPSKGQRPEMPSEQFPEGADMPEGLKNGRGGEEDFADRGMGGGMTSDHETYIKITGGIIRLDSQADGIDSNGNLYLSGGEVYISGPVSGGDGALDYDGEAAVTGGILIAAGSSAMMQGFGDTSTQCSILQNLSATQEAGSQIILTDESKAELLNWSPVKSYQSVVITCPELKQGAVYTLTTGTESTQLTLESVVTSNGGGGMGGRMGGGMRGRDLQKDGQESAVKEEVSAGL